MVAVPVIQDAEFRVIDRPVATPSPDPKIRELARRLTTVAEAMTWWDGPRTQQHIKNGAKGVVIARDERDRLARQLERGWAWLEAHPDAEDFASREAKWRRWEAEYRLLQDAIAAYETAAAAGPRDWRDYDHRPELAIWPRLEAPEGATCPS
jgi:hypothetical protein